MLAVKILYAFYTAIMLLSVIMAIVFRKYLNTRKLIIFIPYLLYTFIQETTIYFLREYSLLQSSAVFYNIYRPITTIVFGIIYYSIPFMKPLRKTIAISLGLYILVYLLVLTFVHSLSDTDGYLALLRGLIITNFAILFLFRYFYLDNPSEENFWKPLVWISTGIILFYPATSISLVFQKYLSEFTIIVAGFKLHQLIPQILSIFMYSCFSYAFYLCKKTV